MCGATHMAKDKTPAECTQMCVKDGMKYALAVEKKVYTLEGYEADLAKLAGQKVTVKGQGNSQGRHALRSGSRRVEIASSFDLTRESVPPFRLFSRRTTHAFGTIGPSNGP